MTLANIIVRISLGEGVVNVQLSGSGEDQTILEGEANDMGFITAKEILKTIAAEEEDDPDELVTIEMDDQPVQNELSREWTWNWRLRPKYENPTTDELLEIAMEYSQTFSQLGVTVEDTHL